MTNWTDHVKAEAQRLNTSYGCALSLPEVKSSYYAKYPDAGKKKKATPKSKVKEMVKSIEEKIKEKGIKPKGKVSIEEIAEEIAEIEKKQKPESLKKNLEQVKKDLKKIKTLNEIESELNKINNYIDTIKTEGSKLNEKLMKDEGLTDSENVKYYNYKNSINIRNLYVARKKEIMTGKTIKKALPPTEIIEPKEEPKPKQPEEPFKKAVKGVSRIKKAPPPPNPLL